ncbi:DUF6907 domain-containing protein [Amycolatopsis sacchari]|uniref:DUF6907 domain-containing protein n=1 Tax=Amycolatopsis sacchari TaxID=115433 RepID=UPI003D71C976
MHSDDERPFWLSAPCPTWCATRHRDADAPRFREHVSEPVRVLLSSMSPRAGGGRYYTEITLHQGYREVSPLIHITATRHLLCTLDEARELGAALLDVARRGAGGSE